MTTEERSFDRTMSKWCYFAIVVFQILLSNLLACLTWYWGLFSLGNSLWEQNSWGLQWVWGPLSIRETNHIANATFTDEIASLLHIEVRLPVLLCAVKTVEGDFRFCWTITPNVGQTHKENPNLVRILYMVCTLNDIYKQYNKLHEHWYTKNQFTSLCRGQKPASKCIRLAYEILVIC